ncbi:MAG: sigma-70 family RNA polymerase sigma factor [Lachnospiraceae bacterium]
MVLLQAQSLLVEKKGMVIELDADRILYDKFLTGDHQALEELIGIHKESLTLFLYGYLKDMSEAENMMIDVFAQLVVSAGKFKGNSTLKTYLFAIARHEALRYLKKHKTHLNLDDVQEDLLPTNHCAEIDLLKKEQNRELYYAIGNLTTDYREILFLLYFENMSYKEASKIMKKSEKQITNLAYRAKKSLKQILEERGFVYDGE